MGNEQSSVWAKKKSQHLQIWKKAPRPNTGTQRSKNPTMSMKYYKCELLGPKKEVKVKKSFNKLCFKGALSGLRQILTSESYDVTTWLTNNCKTHIAQYLQK